MAEVLNLPIHHLGGAFQAVQGVQGCIGANVKNLKARLAAKVVEPLSKLGGNLNSNVMAPLNNHVHGALAKLTPPTAAVRMLMLLSVTRAHDRVVVLRFPGVSSGALCVRVTSGCALLSWIQLLVATTKAWHLAHSRFCFIGLRHPFMTLL